MMDAMNSVDSEPLWSILDQKGTQTMMKQVLGEPARSPTLKLCKSACRLLVRNELPARRQV